MAAGCGLDTLFVASLTLRSIRLRIHQSAWPPNSEERLTYHRGQVAAKLASQGSMHRGWKICPQGSLRTFMPLLKSSVQIGLFFIRVSDTRASILARL